MRSTVSTRNRKFRTIDEKVQFKVLRAYFVLASFAIALVEEAFLFLEKGVSLLNRKNLGKWQS